MESKIENWREKEKERKKTWHSECDDVIYIFFFFIKEIMA